MSVKLPNPGRQPELAFIDVDRLVIDRTYQREVDSAHVQRILEAFSWRFFQAITVTPLKDGKYAVIDGQHRTVAARAHPEVSKIPCVVVDAKTAKEQAEGFIRMNMSQRRISTVEIYWAALAAEEPEYLTMEKLFARCGIQVATGVGTGILPAKTLAAVNTVRNRVRRHGEKTMETALKAVVTAWPDTPNTLTAWIVAATEQVVRLEDIGVRRLADALRPWTPARLIARGRNLAAQQEIKTAEAIVRLIARDLRKDKAA